MGTSDDKGILDDVERLYSLTVSDVMSGSFPLITKKTSIQDVISEIGKMRVYHLWVVENRRNKKLLGVITEEDILRALREPSTPGVMGYAMLNISSFFYGTVKSVEDIMSSPPICCEKETTVGDVMRVMVEENINQLPVVKNGRIIGEITLSRILNFSAKFMKGGKQ